MVSAPRVLSNRVEMSNRITEPSTATAMAMDAGKSRRWGVGGGTMTAGKLRLVGAHALPDSGALLVIGVESLASALLAWSR